MKANKSAGTALVNWEEELAKEAAEDSARTQMPGGQFISFQGGVLSIGGQELAEDSVPIVVLDFVYEHDYFAGAYVPDKPQSPVCFALSRDGKDMAPAPESVDKQHDTCLGCPHLVWGTARGNDGSKRKGKACQERVRLAFLAGNELSAGGIADGESLFARLPVTSVKGWNYYAKGLQENMKRPVWSVITELKLQKSKKNQFNVVFTMKDLVPDEYLRAVKTRHDAMVKDIMFPYTGAATEESDPEAADAPKKRARY
jgi:hypothetical protein